MKYIIINLDEISVNIEVENEENIFSISYINDEDSIKLMKLELPTNIIDIILKKWGVK